MVLNAIQRNALFISGGGLFSGGLFSIISSRRPNYSPNQQRKMFYQGIKRCAYGVFLFGVDPRIGLVSNIYHKAIRSFLTPSTAAILVGFGIKNLYTNFNRNGLAGAALLTLGLFSTITQVTLYILSNP